MINIVKNSIKKSILFIPVYNCENTIYSVLTAIPLEVSKESLFVIVDNGSTDNSISVIKSWMTRLPENVEVLLVKTKYNLGYAGSQKLAYSIAGCITNVEWVVMLHGDAQYNPELLLKFVPFFDTNFNAIYGYRTKTIYGKREETPLITWLSIKILNLIETFYTGIYLKEWHTGFVMYSNDFLRKVNFENFTNSPHMDGQLISFAKVIDGNGISSIPIYKRYKNLVQFSGEARFRYILNVFKLMPIIRTMKRNQFQYTRANIANENDILSKCTLIECSGFY